MAISSAGIGSGLDVASIISKLVAVESIPITQLNTRQQSYKDQLSAYGRIQSATSTLQSAATQLSSADLFQGFSATVGDTSYATATASSSAAAGSFTLRVAQLASPDKLRIADQGTLSSGSLTISLGTLSGGPPATTYTAKANTTPVTVNFAGGTLDDLQAAINSANAGVTATIVNGATRQLVLTSNETGEANSIQLGGSGGLSAFTYDPLNPGSSNFTETAAAQNAQAFIDGISVTSSTNTLTNAVTGVNVTLLKAHPTPADPLNPVVPTEATTLVVGSDTAGMTTKVQSFVKAWNDMDNLFGTLTKYDPTTKTGATLTGDSSVTSMRQQLRNILFSSPSGASSIYPRLSDLGVTLQADGSLSLDTSKLSTAISTNQAAVTATMTAFGSAFKTTTDSMLSTDGILTSKTSSLNTTIASMDDRRDALQRNVDAVQARYQKQFSALDALMGTLQTQSTYLTQQLAKL